MNLVPQSIVKRRRGDMTGIVVKTKTVQNGRKTIHRATVVWLSGAISTHDFNKLKLDS